MLPIGRQGQAPSKGSWVAECKQKNRIGKKSLSSKPARCITTLASTPFPLTHLSSPTPGSSENGNPYCLPDAVFPLRRVTVVFWRLSRLSELRSPTVGRQITKRRAGQRGGGGGGGGSGDAVCCKLLTSQRRTEKHQCFTHRGRCAGWRQPPSHAKQATRPLPRRSWRTGLTGSLDRVCPAHDSRPMPRAPKRCGRRGREP